MGRYRGFRQNHPQHHKALRVVHLAKLQTEMHHSHLLKNHVDVLFNNAGMAKYTLAERTTDADGDIHMDINVRAVFRCCREQFRTSEHVPAEKSRSRAINASSVMAFDTDIGLAAYTASKL